MELRHSKKTVEGGNFIHSEKTVEGGHFCFCFLSIQTKLIYAK